MKKIFLSLLLSVFLFASYAQKNITRLVVRGYDNNLTLLSSM